MNSNISIPPTNQLFPIKEMASRHPNILNEARIRWAARNRFKNGAASTFFSCRGGELFVHEPKFLEWFLGLSGQAKPRKSRRRKQATA